MTVRAFKDEVLRRCDVPDHFALIRLGRGHRLLWLRLNAIGYRGIGSARVSDIDAAVEMTAAEVAEAEAMLADAEARRMADGVRDE